MLSSEQDTVVKKSITLSNNKGRSALLLSDGKNKIESPDDEDEAQAYDGGG